MRNEYGEQLDRNGYAPSVLQTDLTRCWRCGRTTGKLDRHEAFGGANRAKSKRYGLWVMLCHDGCHLGAYGVHYNADAGLQLKQYAQQQAMRRYCWDTDDFITHFGKNYL